MWAAVVAVLQIVYLVLQNMFEKNADEKARKKALYDEAKTAIASRDAASINAVLSKLQQ